MQLRAFVPSMVVALSLAAGQPLAAQVFEQHNLVSDNQTAVPALKLDPDLVNAWGLAAGPTTFWWVANNGTATSTLYDGAGSKQLLVVDIPGADSAPTGVVFNGGSGFVIHDGASPPHSGPAIFIFANEDGSIKGWNPGVPPPPPSTQTFAGVPASPDNIYKGLAISGSPDRLYATNFKAGTVDVYDSLFAKVSMPPGRFTDPMLPAGYAPFGIANLNGTIFVTYALQDADKKDDVPGEGHGFVDAFDTSGHLLRRVASRGQLNSPWGLALAPASPEFGKFSNDLLVGNFGNGRIHAFKAKGWKPGEFHRHGPLRGTNGRPLMIDGLWALAFGKGGIDNHNGSTDTLFFTAGPDGESHGLFGSLTVVPHDDHGHGDDGD